MWPLTPAPEVITRFDPPTSDWGAGHRGVDLLGAPRQAVRTALSGRVSFIGRIAGRGIVVVDHGATRTTYEPVRGTARIGTAIEAGDRIGSLETFGSHCFPRSCLHWGWVRAATYLDPLLLVGAGPVRLLPLWRDLPQPTRASPQASRSPAPPARRLPYAAPPRFGWSPVARWSDQARGCACW